jgi:hypothetical protein
MENGSCDCAAWLGIYLESHFALWRKFLRPAAWIYVGAILARFRPIPWGKAATVPIRKVAVRPGLPALI